MALSRIEIERRYREVQELKLQGYTRKQIHEKTGIPETCVDRYWNNQIKSIDTSDRINPITGLKYRAWDDKPIFKEYEPFVVETLKKERDIKISPLIKKVCEHFNRKTLGISPSIFAEYVDHIRLIYSIPSTVPKNGRRYYRVESEGPGEKGLVDMGQMTLEDMYGNYKKVYFWAIVLEYSRMKYAYFLDHPFHADDFIKAHELAFKFYGGVPKKIVYDQDRVMVYAENYGEIIYQTKFSQYRKFKKFDAYICRGHDPESKGKIESVIKYIKYNFLKDFIYQGINHLNGKCLEWLDKVGNGLVHQTTKKVPQKEFEIERTKLVENKPYPIDEIEQRISSVTKLNEIIYKKNFYSVPYALKGPKEKVRVEEKEGILYIYDPETNELLCTHKVLKGTGGLSIQAIRPEPQLKPRVDAFKEEHPFYREYLEFIENESPRYFYKQFLLLLEIRKRYGEIKVKRAITVAFQKNIYSVPKVLEMIVAADGKEILEKMVKKRLVKTYLRQEEGYERYSKFINEGIDDEGMRQLELEKADELDMKFHDEEDEINYQIDNNKEE